MWWRRLTYFATLAATVLLLMLPLMVARLPQPPILTDGRTWIGGIIRLLTLVLPTFAGEWVEVYADNPFYFLLGAIVVVVLLSSGTWLERRLRDEARRVWKLAIAGAEAPMPAASWIQQFRSSRRYQRFAQIFKWYVLPDGAIAPLMAVLLFWLGLAVYTQTRLPFLENGGTLCRSSPAGVADVTDVRADFRTRDVCSESFGRVLRDERYIVTFDVVDPWYDGRFAATPEGIGAADFPWGLGYVAVPFRRVIDAHYLQPVFEIRPTEQNQNFFSGNVQIYPLVARPDNASPTMYRAEFVAPRTGELFLFANDAMIPLISRWWGKYDYRHFYEASGFDGEQERGNRGSACVSVSRANAAAQRQATPPAESICARAVAREAAKGMASASTAQR